MSCEPMSRKDIALLARLAGLRLAPAHVEELVEAYGLIEPSLQRLRRSRCRADEPAHVYDPRKFMACRASSCRPGMTTG